MVQAPPAPTHVLADRQVDVETPEHVAIGYELADLGSRFTALLIDILVMLGASIGFRILLVLFALATGLNEFMTGIGLGVYVLVSFAAFWGYMVLYEGLRDGQTIGKRRMGIRVVHDGGYPITVRASAIRNFVKLVVDMQPACAIGGLSMMLHPQTKRLGDMAAGTVVVRDRTGQPIPEDSPAAADAPSLGRPLLTDDEFAAVSMYASRRLSLEGHVRAELSRKLMSRVERHVADDARRMQTSPDAYLCLLHQEESARRQAAGAGGRAGTAQATALVRRQRVEWDEYQKLLEAARKEGLDHLGETRVSRFAQLYRGIAADLARARSYGGSQELLYSLERIVGAGHNLFYRPTTRSWRRFVLFLSGGFAALARRLWKPITIASALFYVPAILTFAAMRAQPELAREMIPAHMIARAENAAAKEARGEGYYDVPEVTMPLMAGELISNNVQVTFTAFAGGILAGIGTVLILVFNGLHLGSISGLFANHGQSLHLWTFVAGHGVIELTAICIAGGAGLWLGSAIVYPGRRTRREMLVRRGREAVSLIGGTCIMLVIAGFIEGFISTSALPASVKFLLAAIFALAMISYFTFAGRGEQHRAAAAAAGEREMAVPAQPANVLRQAVRLSLAVLALAACGQDDAPGRAPASSAGAAAGVSLPRDSAPAADTASPKPGAAEPPAPRPAGASLTGTVRKLGERRYEIAGRTRGASTVQITVEDGHDVLYGPVDVPVTGGAFRAEVSLEPTRQRTVYAYLSDPAGTRQWVVTIPLDSAHVRIDARAEGR